jgi:hypothetical protein
LLLGMKKPVRFYCGYYCSNYEFRNSKSTEHLLEIGVGRQLKMSL